LPFFLKNIQFDSLIRHTLLLLSGRKGLALPEHQKN